MNPESDNESIVRSAFSALARGDIDAVLPYVDENIEWIFLDPSVPDPEPQTCYGHREFEYWIRRWAGNGLPTELEELVVRGDRMAVVTHTPGLDERRARRASDRNFHVVTVREGRITELRACRSRSEAVLAIQSP